MTTRIKTLIFPMLLGILQASRCGIPQIAIKYEVGLAHSLIKRAFSRIAPDFSGSLRCLSVDRMSMDDYDGYGVVVKVDHSQPSSETLQDQLSSCGRDRPIYFDDQFYATFMHIFSKPFVTEAAFIRWKDTSERVLQGLADHPDEVLAEIEDPDGQTIEIRFVVNRDSFSQPKLVFKLYRQLGHRSRISNALLTEVLEHICGLRLPEAEVRRVAAWLSQKARNTWINIEMPPSVTENWIVARDLYRFQNMKGVTIKKWVDPKAGLLLKLVETKNHQRFLVAWSGRRRHFALMLLPTLVAGQEKYAIIGTKWVDKPILVSEAKVAEYLWLLSGVAFPVHPLTQIVHQLARRGSRQNFILYVPLDLEMRIAQLTISQGY